MALDAAGGMGGVGASVRAVALEGGAAAAVFGPAAKMPGGADP
jgi:hypothetical protein